MNCAECRELWTDWKEGLLPPEQSGGVQAHLETCAACRAEAAALSRLTERLQASARASAEVALAGAVMQRVLRVQNRHERYSSMIRLFTRLGFGLGAAAGVAALLLLLLGSPKAQATAVAVLARGAKAAAGLSSIHLRGQLRTLPADNFGHIDPDGPFYAIELWKQFEPDLKWRVEKPQRVVVMDGQSVVMWIKPANLAVKYPHQARSAFDTEWLQRIANLSNTITNELKNALAKGWKLSVADETGADGRPKSVVTILARPGVPDNDYCKNTFMENADTRRVYRFDAQSELLETVQVYVMRPGGEVQIFALDQIQYNQPLDASLWKLAIPADVNWAPLPEELPRLPDNEKYASLTAQEAARAFFEACARKDWAEAAKFQSPLTERMKSYLGGLELISLGEPFTSKNYPGRFVPYEIGLQPQDFYLRVSNSNSASRYVITGSYDGRQKLQQELNWTNPPALLPNNDAYAKLSPLEAVKAYFAAAAKLDWEEMRKFAPDYDVDNDKAQLERVQKQGLDPRKIMPQREALEAVWSDSQGGWLVKYRLFQVKKWNLALRKDNPVGRWQVDGGL